MSKRDMPAGAHVLRQSHMSTWKTWRMWRQCSCFRRDAVIREDGKVQKEHTTLNEMYWLWCFFFLERKEEGHQGIIDCKLYTHSCWGFAINVAFACETYERERKISRDSPNLPIRPMLCMSHARNLPINELTGNQIVPGWSCDRELTLTVSSS